MERSSAAPNNSSAENVENLTDAAFTPAAERLSTAAQWTRTEVAAFDGVRCQSDVEAIVAEEKTIDRGFRQMRCVNDRRRRGQFSLD